MRKTIFWLYVALMLCTSVIPMDVSSPGYSFFVLVNPTLQNLLHIPMFTGFTLLLFWLRRDFPHSRLLHPISVLLIALLWGIVLESLQIFIPGRYAGLSDLLLNLCGAGLGEFIAVWWRI